MQHQIPTVQDSLLMVIDVQNRLMPVIHDALKTIQNIQTLITGAGILGISTLVTEQYPKGLGNTISDLDFNEDTTIIEKNAFSCMIDEKIKSHLLEVNKHHLILCGVESHICVLKTALNAVEQGYTVHVVADAVSSRAPENKILALERLRQSGVYIVSAEMVLFMLMDKSGTDTFKSISKLIK